MFELTITLLDYFMINRLIVQSLKMLKNGFLRTQINVFELHLVQLTNSPDSYFAIM